MDFILLTILFLSASCYCKDIVVSIEDGQVRGEIVQFNNLTIDVFKGIRFGKPPIDDLRFKRPVKAEKWTQVYDATTEKYSCWQPDLGVGLYFNMSEDCLFLNVWAPHNAKDKPVMVWFYGGGLQMGSIWQINYNALPLTIFDVVVVSVNYRIGPMGFLYGGTEDAPGNAGLYDQLLGLKWVKKNIQAFGGNPNQVTIFGESAGAWSVSYHILSPLSKGLFKNAIIQSGSIYTDASFMSKTQNLKDSKEYSAKLGCKDEKNWIKCLKQLEPQQINDYNIDFGKFIATIKFLPVVGEAFYPIESYEAVKTGKFNSDINILAGITADEGTIFVHKWFAEIDSDPTKFNQNVKNYLNIILKFWKNLESGNERRNVIEAYISDEKDVNNIKSKVGQIFGDYVLTCPTYYFSRDIVLWSGFSNVYMYELTYKSSMSFSSFIAPPEPWIGIGHGDDIEFVFGTSLLAPQRYSQQDYNFALLIMNLWTNFAKTGDPMKGQFTDIKLPGIHLENVKWPTLRKVAFDKLETKVMNLNPQKFGTLLDNPFKKYCEDLWEPILMETSQERDKIQDEDIHKFVTQNIWLVILFSLFVGWLLAKCFATK